MYSLSACENFWVLVGLDVDVVMRDAFGADEVGITKWEWIVDEGNYGFERQVAQGLKGAKVRIAGAIQARGDDREVRRPPCTIGSWWLRFV